MGPNRRPQTMDDVVSFLQGVRKRLREGGPAVDYRAILLWVEGSIPEEGGAFVFRRMLTWRAWWDACMEILTDLAVSEMPRLRNATDNDSIDEGNAFDDALSARTGSVDRTLKRGDTDHEGLLALTCGAALASKKVWRSQLPHCWGIKDGKARGCPPPSIEIEYYPGTNATIVSLQYVGKNATIGAFWIRREGSTVSCSVGESTRGPACSFADFAPAAGDRLYLVLRCGVRREVARLVLSEVS
jgi:hypothetical protein